MVENWNCVPGYRRTSKYLLSEPEETYGKPQTLDEAFKLLEEWKNKYLELVDKYNRLIEEKIKK